jgi:1-deoxy-D-xylulose 5-phosphate reductoisomerase
VTPGLSNALAFKAQASTITSVDQILGNPTMRTVITTTLGIPQQIAFQDLTAQERAISTRVDITKFQDPKFVETFVQQYLIANAANASSSSSAAPDLTTLAVQGQGLLV